jgi:hypothetical protein
MHMGKPTSPFHFSLSLSLSLPTSGNINGRCFISVYEIPEAPPLWSFSFQQYAHCIQNDQKICFCYVLQPELFVFDECLWISIFSSLWCMVVKRETMLLGFIRLTRPPIPSLIVSYAHILSGMTLLLPTPTFLPQRTIATATATATIANVPPVITAVNEVWSKSAKDLYLTVICALITWAAWTSPKNTHR